MVNTQELQGSWNKLKGQVKEKWGALTDDDLQLHGGNVDQVVGKIQQRTGESREAIEEFLNSLTSRGASALSQAAEMAGQYAQRAGSQIRDRYQDVADQVGEGYEQAESMVRRNPAQSVATAFGVGLALGVLVGLSLRSSR
ncbi:MAG: CsbD family protein [Isosphaeraceae bacterium]